jgi:hypothetical protein
MSIQLQTTVEKWLCIGRSVESLLAAAYCTHTNHLSVLVFVKVFVLDVARLSPRCACAGVGCHGLLILKVCLFVETIDRFWQVVLEAVRRLKASKIIQRNKLYTESCCAFYSHNSSLHSLRLDPLAPCSPSTHCCCCCWCCCCCYHLLLYHDCLYLCESGCNGLLFGVLDAWVAQVGQGFEAVWEWRVWGVQ